MASALEREVHLARRACWTTATGTTSASSSFADSSSSRSKTGSNANSAQQPENNDNGDQQSPPQQQQLINKESQFYNGATINNNKKINDNNYLISNNDKSNNDNVKNNYFKSIHNSKKLAVDKDKDYSLNSKIFQTVVDTKRQQDEMPQRDGSATKFSSISIGDKMRSLLNFNLHHTISKHKFLIVYLLTNLLLCQNCIVSARPNQSTVSNLVPSSDASAFGTQSQQLSPADLASLPDVELGKRAADSTQLASPASSVENPHATEEEHTPGRYPVSSIDFERVETPFIIGVWILFASIAKIGFHMTPKLNKIFPESCLLIVVGVIIGIVLLYATNVRVSPLTPETFFFYMLPPIILDAGYFMPNRLFFDNIGTILLMAVVGTIWNISTIGGALYGCGLTGMFNVETPILDMFLFASLIAAVDPVAVLAVFEEIHVNEILYIVVFGESLLNDAVTVVLYHMFEAYNEMGVSNIQIVDLISGVASFFVVALGGTLIGVIWGFLTGLVTRFTDHVRVIEPIFIFVMAYLAYLNAEIFHMSGILAITFCGITMKNYVEANISHKSHTTIKYALKMLSSSSETIIFMFLGVATINNQHIWNTWFIVLTIIFCSVFRIIGVLILTAMANRFRIHKLTNVDQFVMSYGGLRGAVAFALVLLIDKDHIPLQPMFVTTTIAVIYFTVFLQGITIKPLVKILKVKRADKRKPTMNERIHERFIDHLMAGVEDIVGKTGNYNVRDKFKRFDNKFIRPYLIRDLQGAEPKIIETYSKLTMKDAMDFMRRNPSTIGQMSGTESMSALFRNYTGYFGGSPSFSNLENTSRNLDMQELDYNPSKKDLTDAKIHHLLAEELKSYRRHRRLSYSRHAVDDRDLSTQVNYKMHMNIRRMVGDRKHHKRSKRMHKDGSAKQNHVSFPEFQQNGSAKQFANDYINEVLHEGEEDPKKNSPPNDDWDSGLTFTAKSSPDNSPTNSRSMGDGDAGCSSSNGGGAGCSTSGGGGGSGGSDAGGYSGCYGNSSLIAHITSLPGFDPSKARIVKHYSSRSSPDKDSVDIIPTAAEAFLPWRRDKSYQSFVDEGGETSSYPEDTKRFSKESEGEYRVTTPTAIESVLPWKRGDDSDEENGAVKQNEFPSWASNKEYLAYSSPSATFLGLFRRESSASGGPAAISDSDSSIPATAAGASGQSSLPPISSGRATSDRRASSVAASIGYDDANGDPLGAHSQHAGAFPITASHRRNTRRGSMLELSGDPIPEENYTKSLPERARQRASTGTPLLRMTMTTPKTQHRKLNNPQATALLSASSTEESSTDEEDDRHYCEQNPL